MSSEEKRHRLETEKITHKYRSDIDSESEENFSVEHSEYKIKG